MTDLFNVFWWDRDGGQHKELSNVEVMPAMQACKRLTQGPASVLGIVERVIITDTGDCCVFEWIKDIGVTFPRKPEGAD